MAEGCARAPATLLPEAAAFAALPAAEFAALAVRTDPARSELVALRWRFRDPNSEVSGRGAVRLSPPDSVRLDVRGPLGFGHGTLVMAGAATWADPADVVQQVLPRRHLLWAMLGVVRAPEGAQRFAAAALDGRRFVRVAADSGESTTFELRGDTLAGLVVMRDQRTVGRLTLVRDRTGGVAHADAEDLERHARLTFDIQSRTGGVAFPPEVWRHP